MVDCAAIQSWFRGFIGAENFGCDPDFSDLLIQEKRGPDAEPAVQQGKPAERAAPAPEPGPKLAVSESSSQDPWEQKIVIS